MANIRAIANGNWSNNAIWSPAPPTSVDDVFASGFTVYVDTNIQVLSINTIGATGIGGGGTFRPNNGVIMTTNVVAGSTTCVTFGSASPNAFTLVGNVSGGNAANAFGINNSSTGNIAITGNIVGGSVNAVTYGINNALSGLITVSGNVSGSPFATGGVGIYNATTGRSNVVGNVQGGLANHGVAGNVNTTVVNITGNVFGGSGSNIHGISFPYGSIVTVYGDVYGGTGASSAGMFLNNATSYPPMTGIVYGNVFGGTGSNAPGISLQTNSNLGPNLIYITGNIRTLNGSGLASTGVAFITGNIFGSDTNSTSNAGASFSSTASATIIGNVYGGSQTSTTGLNGSVNGVITVTGNVFGGSGSNAYGYTTSSSTSRVTINGSVSGGTGSSSFGAYNSVGTLTVTGSAYAGPGGTAAGVYVDAGGTTTILGSVVGLGPGSSSVGFYQQGTTSTAVICGAAIAGDFSSTAYGAFINSGSGTIKVKRAIGNNWGLGYTTAVAGVPGIFNNSQTGQMFVEELQCGSRGQWPTGGVIFFTPNTKATSMFETDTFQNVTLIESNSADNLLPAVSSVRQGTTYNLGLSTGTCILPPTSSVAAGALVDNLTGTATLTPQTTWNFPITGTNVNSMGGRLDNALNTQAAGILINSFNP